MLLRTVLLGIATLSGLIIISVLGNLATKVLEHAVETPIIKDLTITVVWLALGVFLCLTAARIPWNRLIPDPTLEIKGIQTDESVASPYIPESLSTIVDYGRLHASLSALRLNGQNIVDSVNAWIPEEQNTLNQVVGIIWANRSKEWSKAIERVLEAWDQVPKSEIFRAGAFLPAASIDPSETKDSVLVWMKDKLGRLDGIMKDLPITIWTDP